MYPLSSSFQDQTRLTSRYLYSGGQGSRCPGDNYSPALSWSQGPPGTMSCAITMYDPDAIGGFMHWAIYNIPVTTTALPEMKDGLVGLPSRIALTTNDFGFAGYGGPCPPPGKIHHYIFTIYALSKLLTNGLSSRELTVELNKYTLAKGSIVGLFSS